MTTHETRLAHLERGLRRWRWYAAVLVVALIGCLGFSWYLLLIGIDGALSNGSVAMRIRSLEVINEDGNAVITLGVIDGDGAAWVTNKAGTTLWRAPRK